jgi:2TM domain
MANSELSDHNRIYTQEEVQQILNLAIAQHAYEGEFSRAQLLEIAEDLAIPSAIVHQAERAWIQSNDENLKREAFNQHRRGELKQKIVSFTIVNAILIAGFLALKSVGIIGFFGFFSFLWYLFWWLYVAGLVCWSIALGLKTWNVFHLEGDAYEQAFQRWYRTHKVRSLVSRWFDRLLSA